MASAAIPGLGDWILGDRKRGGLFLALFLTVLLCYLPLRLPRFYWPFILLILTGQILNAVSGCCTFLLRRSMKDSAANWWIFVVIALGLISVQFERKLELLASGFQVFSVPSDSMAPTIDLGDYVVVDKWYFRDRKPEPNQVIVFQHRAFSLMKRVVATDASTIQGVNGRVQVNGRPLAEPYVVHRDVGHSLDELDNFGPFKLTAGEIFVMGDNRDFSLDSRIRSGSDDFGAVMVTDVIGKPLYRSKGSITGSSHDGQVIK